MMWNIVHQWVKENNFSSNWKNLVIRIFRWNFILQKRYSKFVIIPIDK